MKYNNENQRDKNEYKQALILKECTKKQIPLAEHTKVKCRTVGLHFFKKLDILDPSYRKKNREI